MVLELPPSKLWWLRLPNYWAIFSSAIL